jgi:hypothetical protein
MIFAERDWVMLTISVTADVKSITARLNDLARKQMPFALAGAVNDVAFQVQRAEKAAIQATFAHPRPFTANSVQVDKATKGYPVATVKVRPEVAKYLQPYETGGVHVLPGTALLDPVDIKLDQYGQLPQNTMANLRARQDIFIGRVMTKNGVINGVWQRLAISRKGNVRRKRLRGGRVFDATQGALKLLIRFGNAVPVTKHLGFHDRAVAIVKAVFVDAFASALGKAIGSAR